MNRVPSRSSSVHRISALLLPQLRERTRDLHASVESVMDISSRLATLDSYRDLLRRLYGYYFQVEETCGSASNARFWQALGLEYTKMRKAPLLEVDLMRLGASRDEFATLRISAPSARKQFSAIGEIIGTSYVHEGASLGGQIIGRLLEKSLGIVPGSPGGCFFNGYGSNTVAEWRKFCSSVEGYLANREIVETISSEEIAETAVYSARQTFSNIEYCLKARPELFCGGKNN